MRYTAPRFQSVILYDKFFPKIMCRKILYDKKCWNYTSSEAFIVIGRIYNPVKIWQYRIRYTKKHITEYDWIHYDSYHDMLYSTTSVYKMSNNFYIQKGPKPNSNLIILFITYTCLKITG